MNDDPSSHSLLARFFQVFGVTRPVSKTQKILLNGKIDSAETDVLLANVREFQNMRVDDVMVPRAEIVTVEIKTPLEELARLFVEATHSRLPVFRETLDDPVGVAHIKDVVGYLYTGKASVLHACSYRLARCRFRA